MAGGGVVYRAGEDKRERQVLLQLKGKRTRDPNKGGWSNLEVSLC